MSDYAKLIGELYLVASQAKSNNRRKLLERAADAIEDLEFACNRYEKDYKLAQSHGGLKGVVAIEFGNEFPVTTPRPGRRGDMNCDYCKYYRWYYDRCERWGCEVDAREVHNCFEGKSPVEVDDG